MSECYYKRAWKKLGGDKLSRRAITLDWTSSVRSLTGGFSFVFGVFGGDVFFQFGGLLAEQQAPKRQRPNLTAGWLVLLDLASDFKSPCAACEIPLESA